MLLDLLEVSYSSQLLCRLAFEELMEGFSILYFELLGFASQNCVELSLTLVTHWLLCRWMVGVRLIDSSLCISC